MASPEASSPSLPAAAPPVPLWLRIGWTLWFLVWFPSYLGYWYGVQGNPFWLWYCNIGNFVIALAVWWQPRLLFSWQAVSTLPVQLPWVIDVAGRVLTGRHPFGFTDYVFGDEYPLLIRLMAFYHAFTPPIVIWMVWRLGYDRRGFLLQLASIPPIMVLSFLLGRKDNVNWAWGPDGEQTWMAPWLYLLVCIAVYPLMYGIVHVLLCALMPRARLAIPPSSAMERSTETPIH